MSVLSSVSSQPAAQINGLVTGLNTDQIIQGLLAVDQQRINLLKQRQDTYTQDQTAFKGIEAKLISLQSAVSQLARPQNGAFDGRTVTSSNQDLVTAAASSSAAPGVYTFRVNSLAQAQQIASQGFDSPTSAITQGTFQIQSGSGPTTTITIDGTNNTLQGLVDAINASGAGVTASLINDGSDSRTQPYRLLLTANQAGVANAITITNNLAADSGGARRPEFGTTYINQAVTAANYTGTATPTVNAGAGGYTGTSNNTYTFTVTQGGTVGTDNGIQISYTDATGANTGTITLNSGDAGKSFAAAQGIQLSLSAGTLVQGQTFTVDAFVPTVQQAANASVTLGSGAGALTVQSATNQMDGLIPGVTLNLQSADPTRTVTLTVANDTDTAKKAIQGFVDAYNQVMSFIDDQVHYDPNSGQGGPLLGDQSAISIQETIRRAATDAVAGIAQQVNHLSAIGITTNEQGQLDLDESKLDAALSGQVSGVTLAGIRSLFALGGSSTNPGVQFITGSDKTQATGSPVQVDITQAATQGSMTATNALAASTVIDNTNNTFTLTLDGKTSSTLTLAAGTYSPDALAQQVQALINGDSTLSGRQVAVSVSGDKLVFTSSSYGSSSRVAIGTGSALTALGFTGSENGSGLDVAGNFIINGQVEQATGNGQLLTGNSGNANTDGLVVRVALTPSQVVAGPEASLTVSRGVASKTALALNSLLDPLTGRLKTIDDSFQSSIDDLSKEIQDQTDLMNARHDALVAQFTALEQTVSQLQTTSTFLGNQLGSLGSLGIGSGKTSSSSSSSTTA